MRALTSTELHLRPAGLRGTVRRALVSGTRSLDDVHGTHGSACQARSETRACSTRACLNGWRPRCLCHLEPSRRCPTWRHVSSTWCEINPVSTRFRTYATKEQIAGGALVTEELEVRQLRSES